MKRRKDGLYGVMAEFDDPQKIIAAAKAVRAKGFTKVDAYTPYPIEELQEALGHHDSILPRLVLLGGILGAAGGFYLQYWINVTAYPLNIGGKPFNSWPAFVPVAFECTILLAALTAVLGMLAINGLPLPYHPVFNVERFALASRDHYFLCIEAKDAKFDAAATAEFLWTLEPTHVAEVES